MSLVSLGRAKPRWLLLAAAAAAAVAVPASLLDTTELVVAERPAPSATTVTPRDAGSLSFAESAPPFSPARVPPGIAAASQALPPDTVLAEAPPPAPPPRVVGLVTGPGGKGVALARSGGGDTTALRVGDSIDGWRLVGVGRRQATFERGGARHAAAPEFAPGEGAKGAKDTPVGLAQVEPVTDGTER